MGQDRHHDLAVRRLFRHGAGNERAVGYTLPRLFPDGGWCSLCLGGVLRADELVRTLARRYLQRLLVCQVWLPRTYLGSVPLPLLRRHLSPWLRLRGEHPAVVRRSDCALGLLDFRADDRGHQLRYRSVHEPQAACVHIRIGGSRRKLGLRDCLWCFYKPLGPIDTLLPFKIHGLYVIFWALTSPAFYWKDKGGMFWKAADPAFQ